MLGILGTPWAAQGNVRGELALQERLQLTLGFGGLRSSAGELRLRDTRLGARALAVRRDYLMIAVEPGVTFPTGSIGANAGPLPTTTGSVDPDLLVDAVVGSQVLGMWGAQARVPIVKGRDDLRQGAYLRSDLRLGVRLGHIVPWLGASGLVQMPSTRGNDGLRELAAVGGAWWTVSDVVGLGLQARVPVVTDASQTYPVAVGALCRTVFRARSKEDH